jgi:hypothetical protein
MEIIDLDFGHLGIILIDGINLSEICGAAPPIRIFDVFNLKKCV